MRCEDYPCCGHGPAPHGDGGGCPDEEGRFACVLCGAKMPARATSAICEGCRDGGVHDPDDPDCMCRRCVVAACEDEEEALPCGHPIRYDDGGGWCLKCERIEARGGL